MQYCLLQLGEFVWPHSTGQAVSLSSGPLHWAGCKPLLLPAKLGRL